MSFLRPIRKLILDTKCINVSRGVTFHNTSRNLTSKSLYYSEFGDPVDVVKFREVEVPPLKSQEVLVRMLAAPVNPADINTIQGKYPVKIQLPNIPGNEGVGVIEDIGKEVSGRNFCLPRLPCVPGDEGVGVVVEIGNKVCTVEPDERVVITSRLLGTWQYYGIYHERDVHVISPNIPLPEASMLTIAPCMAYRMLKDFRKVQPGQTVIQNAANSACGQCLIQLCKAWDIKTFNIVANHCNYESVRKHLLSLGATAVHTLEEAEELSTFNTSLTRPVLGLNCLGGRFEDVMLKLLEKNGTIVYYGSAFDIPIAKHVLRCDVSFNRFHLCHWDAHASVIEKDAMMNNIITLMVTGKFKAPTYQPLELKNYAHAFKNTVNCEAFSNNNYVFDFTLT